MAWMPTRSAIRSPACWRRRSSNSPPSGLLAGLAIASIGLLPGFATATWAAFALCLFFGLVGAALRLSQWLLDLSPFSHIPKAPAAPASPAPLLWLMTIAVALAAAGLVG